MLVVGERATTSTDLDEDAVQVVMITGDHPATADAIASTVNGEHDQRVITGAELDELDDDQLATITAAILEGCAMWTSVRAALAILLGGNLGEIGFSVLAALLTGRAPLTARQFLLVNLLTDLAPALAVALRPPDPDEADDLLNEGPSASLGRQLNRDIALRAATTTLGASTAWALARLTGRRRRASTVALAALVGTQLGQTLVIGEPVLRLHPARPRGVEYRGGRDYLGNAAWCGGLARGAGAARRGLVDRLLPLPEPKQHASLHESGREKRCDQGHRLDAARR